MNWFNWLQFSLSLATQLLPLIQGVEQAVGAGKGATKQQAVVAGAVAAATLAGANQQQVQAIQTTLPAAIDANVAALNAAGVLKKAEGNVQLVQSSSAG